MIGMRRTALLSLLIFGSGCSYYKKADGDRLANEVFALQSQVAAMQQALNKLQSEASQLNASVGEVKKSSGRNSADLGVELQEAREQVAQMRGRVESFTERLSALEAQGSKVQEELDLRFQGLAEQQKIEKAKSEAERQAAVQEAVERERLLDNPKKVLATVRKELATNHPTEARKLLREVTLRKKDDKRFRRYYAAEAQFLIGETFFGEANYQQAAAEYNTVRKKYPRSRWTANALYKLGRCFEHFPKMKADAKYFYQEVVKHHSRSSVAKEAKKRLKAL